VQTILHHSCASAPLNVLDPLLVFDERVYTTSLVSWQENSSLAVDCIAEFVGKIIQKADFSCEVLITALCIFTRFMRHTGTPQSMIPMIQLSKWRLMFLTTLLVAQKTWDDSSLDNASFAIIWRYAAPSFDDEPGLKHFNEMESLFLNLMRFDVYVSPRLYAEVYFDLSSIYIKKFGTGVPIMPLDRDQTSFLDSLLKNHRRPAEPDESDVRMELTRTF